MFKAAGDYQVLINLLFLAVTGTMAWYGIRFRDEDGKQDFVRLLFGVIGAVFFFVVLAQTLLGFF